MDDIKRPRKRPPVFISDETDKSKLALNPQANKGGEYNIPEPKFVPPEELAADEDIHAAAKTAPFVKSKDKSPDDKKPEDMPKRRFNVNLHMPHGKKQWLITIL